MLYKYCTGYEIENAHTADGDVNATIAILKYDIFWNNRKYCIKPLPKSITDTTNSTSNNASSNDANNNYNSDTDCEEDMIDDDNEDDIEFDDRTNEFSSNWEMNEAFKGVDSKEKFHEYINQNRTRSSSNNRNIPRLGPQPSKSSINSPIKAWRFIFTESILNKIVKYTNDYGDVYCKDWNDITRTDLTDFFAVLFITSIQKRKDKTRNWFSNDPVLENIPVKKIMSGKKFHKILRYIHVCDMYNQPNVNAPDYDPIYKVKELLAMLEGRFQNAFEPGYALSLDESLIRTFGRIKFKVRIVTKSARYGIKVYVLTDAVTAYVLKVIFYTGKHTYHPPPDGETLKKTVQVVKELVLRYKGSFRCVYVDRFYTLIELMKELDTLFLFVTGTCMKNRLPIALRFGRKSSAEWKRLTRGESVRHVYQYKDSKDTIKRYGLVCWKDRDIVYALTNCVSTEKYGVCYRRTSQGRICIERPKLIEEYNEFMGGVDLADMRRLGCNSTIMGLHRWWLKFFFYLLDVGTANALVLYRYTTKDDINIMQYKRKLIQVWVSDRISGVTRSIADHCVIRNSNNTRLRCVYCAVMGKFKRTRFRCKHPQCAIPLCSVGSGTTTMDCFALAHKSKEIRKLHQNYAVI